MRKSKKDEELRKAKIRSWVVKDTRGNKLRMKARTKTDAGRAASNLGWMGPVVAVEDPDAKPKVAANARCPCGSGRKYKRCCGKDKRHG